MAIILPKRGGFGETLGAGAGAGLQQLLQGLGTGLEQRQQANALEQMGIPRGFVGADPRVLARLLQGSQAAQIQNQQQAQERQAESTLEKIKRGLSVNEMPRQEEIKEGEASVPQQDVIPPKPKYRSREHRLALENENLEQALLDPTLSDVDRGRVQQAIEQNEEKLQKVREYRDKKFGKELGGLREGYLAAQDQKEELDRLKELEKEGLTSSKLTAFLEGAGLNIPALKNPQSEEFEKIIANNLRNARQYFGGKITDFEIRSFMKTLPSLLNSPEGRKRIVAQLDRLNNLKELSYKTAQNIIKKNKGIAPDNLWEQVDNKVEKKRKNITDQFKKDLEREVPEAESKVGIATSYGAGKALPIAGGAALGAGIGSLFGPGGTGIGAGIGAGSAAAAPYISNLINKLSGR